MFMMVILLNKVVNEFLKKEKMSEIEVMISASASRKEINEEETEVLLLNRFLNILQKIKQNFE